MGRTGRPPQHGDERWMTVPEAAAALGITPQAIRNRMLKTETLPYDQQIDLETGTPHYRVPRHVIEEEARQKNVPATREHTAELDLALGQRTEQIIEAITNLKNEVISQRKEVTANQLKMLGTLEGMQNALNEVFREVRRATARAEEEDRVEQQYQQNNLALGKEVRDLQKQTLELLSRVEQAEAEREARGLRERRSFWRRMFGSVFG